MEMPSQEEQIIAEEYVLERPLNRPSTDAKVAVKSVITYFLLSFVAGISLLYLFSWLGIFALLPDKITAFRGQHTILFNILFVTSFYILAVFTYFASDGVPQTVFGYGQLIKSNGESIETEEKELFQNEDELIIINKLPIVSFEQHREMYDNYYSHLQNAIDSIKTNGVIENVDALRTAFKAIIPTEAIELYKRICPSFLELIKE